MSDLEAIVLVGGRGTRLRAVVADRPKPMAEVLGRPFLEWIILYLRNQGIRRIILATGYRGEMVRAHFGNGRVLEVDIQYAQEDQPLGTGGAVRNAWDVVSNEQAFVLNGDSFCFFSVSQMQDLMFEHNAKAVLWGVHCEDAGRYGSLAVDESQHLLAFREKQETAQGGLINAGIYLLRWELIAQIPRGQAVSLEHDVFPRFVGRDFFVCPGDGPFIDIGTPESYVLAERFILEHFLKRSNVANS